MGTGPLSTSTRRTRPRKRTTTIFDAQESGLASYPHPYPNNRMIMKICTRCKGQHATEARTCLACRTQSAAYQRTKRRENPHLCGSCLCRPRLKGKSKCQSCFDSHAQWEINRFRKKRMCRSCSNLVEKSCYKSCESCRERDRERHRIKWMRAFVLGLCRQCGIRTPAQGYVRCAFCLDIAARCAIEIERKRATTPSVP